MRFQRARAWLLSIVVGTGLAGVVPAFALARDREEQVKYEDTPREVRQTLDRERGRYDIKRIDHVVRDGRSFYRATIDNKGGTDTVVRVGDNGKVLSSAEVGDPGERRDAGDTTVVKYNSLPARVKDALDRERGGRDLKIIYEVRRGDRHYYNAIVDERNGDRSVRINDDGKLLGEEDLREVRTAGARYDSADLRRGYEDDGERIAYDRLPGEVKTTIGREAKGERVGNVYRYDRRGSTVYEAEVYGPNGTHVVRVNENGRVVSDTDSTAEGRRSVRFEDLPGAVKDAIGHDIPRDRLTRVVEITQDGRTYYRAQMDNGRDRDPTWVTVDSSGRTVRDFDRGR